MALVTYLLKFRWRMAKDQMTHSMANGEGSDKTDAKRVCVIVQSSRSRFLVKVTADLVDPS
jgi:hypothetical protein